MRTIAAAICLLCLSTATVADKPAPASNVASSATSNYKAAGQSTIGTVAGSTSNVAPAASAATPVIAQSRQDQYGSPQAAPVAPAADEYGSPQAAPISSPTADEYGSPQAPVVSGNSYSAPAAAPAAQSPAGSQGYYYYYYPVRQASPPSYAAPPPANNGDGGLLTGLAAIAGAILGKKILVGALIIAGLLVLAALGVNIAAGRSFGDSVSMVSARAAPYLTEENLATLAEYVQAAIDKFEH